MRFDITPISAPTLTGLTATPGLNSIVLQWDVPAASTEHVKTRVYMATSPSTGAAAMIAEVSGNTYTHAGLSPTTRYYWVRSVNAYGREDGAYSSMVTIASTLVTALDIASAAVTAAKLSVAGIDASGQLIASQIAAGTIAAGVIYAGSITAAQISASTLSAITANLGSVTAGSITGTANIDIAGSARFRGSISGSYGSAATYVNDTGTSLNGLIAVTNGGAGAALTGYTTNTGINSGFGVLGIDSGSGIGVSGGSVGGIGVYGESGSATEAGVFATNTAGGNALETNGPAYITGNLTVSGSIIGTVSYATSSGSSSTSTYAGTAGEVNNPGNAALRALSGTHAAIMQTDGNFVVYNSGVPVGSSTGGFPSDARLKVNIAATRVRGSDLIMALRVVDHGWAPGTPMHDKVGDQIQVGLIAQEVRETLPGLVTEVADTLLLNKTEIIPVLIKHNQELELRVQALEQKIAELSAIVCNK